MESITMRCPKCGTTTTVNVDRVGWLMYNNGTPIQDAFPNMSAFDREVILSGYCYNCQEEIFNRPAPGHEAEWGDPIGECGCCGSQVYSKRNLTPQNTYVCSCCGELV